MTTSWLAAKTTGFSTSPSLWSCRGYSVSAERKTSALAPWRICAASVSEPANEVLTVAAGNDSAYSVTASVSEEAPSTTSSPSPEEPPEAPDASPPEPPQAASPSAEHREPERRHHRREPAITGA